MSTISGISGLSSAANPYLTSAIQTSLGQTLKDYQAIGSALQSGNLSTAKTALTAFQHDFPAALQSAASQPFGKNSQANMDYQNLTSALNSGNLTAAQKAFTSLQGDLKAALNSNQADATASSSTTSTAGSTGSSFGSMLSKILNTGS